MATDTFLKNPVLIVGTKQEVAAATIQENDLVAVTDERFYTAEEVDDIVSSTEQDIRNAINESEQNIRDDMNASDSELQTQITAHAGEITTIKGDITTINDDLGDLGDQVSAIESKIPNGTTDSNQLVNKQELADTVVDIKGDVNQADSELQSQITAQAERIAELDSEKLDNNLGSVNAGKVLTVDNDGNIIAASTTETGGLVAVAHDTSLKGAGKDSDPLGVADSILEDISTTKNDLGDLGDQVSGIEAKIPEDASEQNQLATRNQITELQSSKQDIATAVNYNNITNCITEIPQDIQLELNNGTLTLKSGSKLYVPNGSGTFDTLTLTADKTATQTANDTRLYFYNGSYIEKFPIAQCFSGSSAPSGYTYMFWYDTTNNAVKKTSDSGSTWESGWSLPFAICTSTNGAISNIDQVFNGFGYIGGTVFTLPGVKGLIPNGRNSDGTLKNSEFYFSNIIVKSYPDTGGDWVFCLSTNSIGLRKLKYDDDKNENIQTTDNTKQLLCNAGTISLLNGTITSFALKTAFHAVDYSEYISSKKSLDGKVSELDNKVSQKVNKSGDTMTGNLGILDGDVIFRDTQTAVAPSTDTWHKSIVQFLDKKDVRVGWIQPFFKTNGTMELRLVSYDPVNGNKYLNLGSNGNLVWDGKPVITTSGGTFTGNIAIQKETPQINLKSTVMDITSDNWAAGRNTIAWCMDKNGYESAGVYNTTDSDGTARATLYVMSRKTGSQVQASLGVGVNSSGVTYATAPNTPSGAGSNEVVTASWAKSKFLPLAGGTMSGQITTKSKIFFETASSTRYRGFLYKPSEGALSMGISRSDSTDWQTFQSFVADGQYLLCVSDDTNTKYLDARSDGTLTWEGHPIIRLIEYRSQTTSSGYTWYRKYSDGWVEQGGMQNIGNSNRTVTFPIAMEDKDAYDLQLTVIDKYRFACVENTSNRTSTSIVVTTGDDSSANNDGTINWYVCGYAAQ